MTRSPDASPLQAAVSADEFHPSSHSGPATAVTPGRRSRPPASNVGPDTIDGVGTADIADAWPGLASIAAVEPPPWLRIETTLQATARILRQAFDHRLAPLGLNLTQAAMLAYVAEYGPVTQTEIADHTSVGRAAAGSAIDHMAAHDLVERRVDPNDRRVWRVALTPAGNERVRQVDAIDQILRAELRAGMSRAQRQALASALTRLQANALSAMTGSRRGASSTRTTPQSQFPSLTQSNEENP